MPLTINLDGVVAAELPAPPAYLTGRGFSPEAIVRDGLRVEPVGDRWRIYGLPAEAADAEALVIPYPEGFDRIRLLDPERWRGGKYRQPKSQGLVLYDPRGCLGKERNAVLVVEGELNALATLEADPELSVVGLPGQGVLSEAMAERLGAVRVVWLWIDMHDPHARANLARSVERLYAAGVEDVRPITDATNGWDAASLLQHAREGGDMAGWRGYLGQLLNRAETAPRRQPVATGEPFPDLLHERAYVGVLGRVVRAIEPHTEADPAAILAQLVAAVGCMVGRGAGWRVEGDYHACAVWPLIVGASSTARKGTSIGRVRQVVGLLAGDFLGDHEVAGLSTGEGLIARLTPPVPDDPDSPPPEWDPRLLVTSAEFAQVLRMIRREGNVLSPVLRELWDHGRAQTLTRHAPLSCRDAHVVVLAHITDAELRRELTETDRANGLANRFLFVAAKRRRSLPFGGDLREEQLQASLGQLAETLERVRCLEGQQLVHFTELGRRLWTRAYPLLTADRNGLAGAACTRAEAQVRRIAVIHALANGQQLVDLEHLAAAIELWRYAEQSARWALGDALGDPDADRLAEILRQQSDPLDREGLRRLEGRHMGAARMTAALALLERRGLVRRWTEATGGRPRELSQWCAESAESAVTPDGGHVSAAGDHLSALTALTAQAEQWEPSSSGTIVQLRSAGPEEAP